MSTNRLKIRAQSLDLELSGERQYVIDAYDAIRGVVMDRFELTLKAAQAGYVPPEEPAGGGEPAGDDRTDTPGKPRHNTQPLYRVDDEGRKTVVEANPNHVHVVTFGEVYHNVSLVERDDLRTSLFGKILDPSHLDRLYVDRATRGALDAVLPLGKTVWRELTSAGKAAIHGSDDS